VPRSSGVRLSAMAAASSSASDRARYPQCPDPIGSPNVSPPPQGRRAHRATVRPRSATLNRTTGHHEPSCRRREPWPDDGPVNLRHDCGARQRQPDESGASHAKRQLFPLKGKCPARASLMLKQRPVSGNAVPPGPRADCTPAHGERRAVSPSSAQSSAPSAGTTAAERRPRGRLTVRPTTRCR
jgi:hypothetical protein